jgi:heptosyltransferase-3
MRRLAIRPGGIGDTLLGLPAITHLARNASLELWARSEVHPLLSYPAHPIEGSGLGLLGLEPPPAPLAARLAAFDEIHSWYGANRDEFRAALSALHPRVFFYPALPADADTHAADFFAAHVAAPLPASPRLSVHPHPSRLVYIHPFSGSARKNWPLERFETLARWLESTGRAVRFLAAPHQHLPGAHVIPTLDVLAATLAGAALYIGNDTGITHLAAAAGANTLALFGPTNPAVWAPRGDRVRILYQPCLEQLSTEFVFDAALDATGFAS